MVQITREKQLFYERLKFTIIDSTRDELDEILRTLIRKENAADFYRELFNGCKINKSGEIERKGFFYLPHVSVPLEYAMYTLLAYAPEDFPLRAKVRSIRFIAPGGEERQALRFPRRLDFFPSLEQLGVVGWSSSMVPKELSRCGKLKYLSLRDNGFAILPEPILKIPNLTHLDMSMNRITSLPEGIGNMAKLQNLSLRGNKLKKIPESLTRIGHLEFLDLSCNDIVELPSSLVKHGSLSRLNLSYNDLNAGEEARWEKIFPLSS